MPREDVEIFEPPDSERLLRVCNLQTLVGVGDLLVIVLLFDSGIRASELIGVEVEDIDWQREPITVLGNGGKSWPVPVSARMLRAITTYLQPRRSAGLEGETRVFVSAGGAPLTYNGLVLALRRLGAKTNLHVHPHKFRHSFAVNALRNQAREFDIQACLGHTTLTMTRHYARQSGADLVEQHKRWSPADRLKVRI